LIEVSIGLVEDVHPKNPPVILDTGARIDSVVAIQRPLPKCLESWHVGVLEETVRVVSELAAVSSG